MIATTEITTKLSPDTQAILLLCASFGQKRDSYPTPLTLSEYNTLARWLRDQDSTPADLLSPIFQERIPKIKINQLESERIFDLLQRGVMLGLAVEKWTSQGLWILGRSDTQYPKRLKQTLKHLAPPILYGVGNIKLLSQGGLAIVGSRDIDQEAVDYTKRLVEICAKQQIQVISGGARGVDQASMLGALEAGGNVVGVLADSLAKSAVSGKYRSGIREGNLTLISPYDPDAGFNTGNAMGRNKYIYGLADYGLVISSTVEKGGTWAGAVEILRKCPDLPVFVRIEGSIPEGNQELLHKGAKPFPESPWNRSLKELIADSLTTSPVILDLNPIQGEIFNQEILIETNSTSETLEVNKIPEETAIIQNNNLNDELKSDNTSQCKSKTAYDLILPLMLDYLKEPKDEKSLAQKLDLQIGQLRIWLKKAVSEGKVIKNKNPVTYVIKTTL
jgi:predicted Rossmann fold nucleotide-binding protein DprA/Smf involved in DNA uptake